MDNFVDKRDFDLLEADKYTFAVLRRIIDKDCEVLLSDHEKNSMFLWRPLSCVDLDKR